MQQRGVPMEEMEALFAGKWYMGWKAKVSPDFYATVIDEEKHKASAQVEEVGNRTPTDQKQSYFEK